MRRSDPGRGGQKPRARPDGRSGNGLVSTIAPLAVGVLLAFGWNMMLSQPRGAAGAESGITRQVRRTVEEVTAQAWASATPHAAPGDDGGQAGRAPVSFGR
ncbi:MAG TPA: hypothetical protein VFV73_14300 [Streptosporangiaceae bacterium]|nr:hypothetical protein [Streptosporangiaceae bacterium]